MATTGDEAPPDSARPAAAFHFSSGRVLLLLSGLTFAVVSVGLGIELITNYFDLRDLHRLNKIFTLNGEANVPAWYSSSLWLLAAALVWIIAVHTHRIEGSFVVRWAGLCAVCVFLSLDEAAMIHEAIGIQVNGALRRWGHLRVDRGWFYAWMYYGIAFVAVFLLAYRRFLLHLPRRVLVLFVTAGSVFLAGAFGMESLSAATEHGSIRALGVYSWVLLVAAEESLEMSGVVLFVYGLLVYMRDTGVGIRIDVRE